VSNQTSVGLLDTSLVIDLHLVKSAQDLPLLPVISVITLAELSVGPLVAKTKGEQLKRQRLVQQVEASFSPLIFDDQCARQFATVAATLRKKGTKSKARAFDALIAATALANQIPLYTRNPADFLGIDDLHVIEVTV
jgi:tRNA(fMet)-specific endonuclease VapC